MTLPEYITANLERPFAWGSFDCVTFAAGWAKECSGKDYLADLTVWTNEKQAARAIKKVGGLEKAIDAQLTRVHPNMAKDGDITLIGRTLYIFSGSQVVGPGIDKLIFLNRMQAKCAWSCVT